MTTREMIEVMEAYERGEKIQVKNKLRAYTSWKDIDYGKLCDPFWDWYSNMYRIKPKEPKFKVGDILIEKDLEGELTPMLLKTIEIESIDNDKYNFVVLNLLNKNKTIGIDSDETTQEIDKNYIKIDDCLWYWEYQTIDGDWRKLDYRYTTEQAQAVMTSSQQKTLTPLYNLGFRLPKEN